VKVPTNVCSHEKRWALATYSNWAIITLYLLKLHVGINLSAITLWNNQMNQGGCYKTGQTCYNQDSRRQNKITWHTDLKSLRRDDGEAYLKFPRRNYGARNLKLLRIDDSAGYLKFSRIAIGYGNFYILINFCRTSLNWHNMSDIVLWLCCSLLRGDY